MGGPHLINVVLSTPVLCKAEVPELSVPFAAPRGGIERLPIDASGTQTVPKNLFQAT